MAVENTLPITNTDYPRIASILVEALLFGDRKTARKYEITTRTIRNYRQLLERNEELSAIFLGKRQEAEGNWARNIPYALIAGIDFIARAAQEADHTDAETIEAVSSAVKTLAEIGLTKEIIDARLDRQYRTDGEEGQQMATLLPDEQDS